MSTHSEDQGAAEHPIDRAARQLGGRSQMAVALGVKPSAIGNWKDRGVPLEHCAAIELACGGLVTRRDLRPDDWRRIWPELAVNDAATTPTETLEEVAQHAA